MLCANAMNILEETFTEMMAEHEGRSTTSSRCKDNLAIISDSTSPTSSTSSYYSSTRAVQTPRSTLKLFLDCFSAHEMKGEIIGYAHKDIYFLETNTKSETTDLANLFAPPSGREMVNYKPRTKLKHKLNPALEFFIQNKTKKTAAAQDNNKGNLELGKCGTSAATNTAAAAAIAASSSTTCPAAITSTATYNCTERPESGSQRSRRNSIDLYEEAASILGLTCSQTDNCKCIECQCHYFDFEEEIDFSTGAEYVMDHNSSCSIQ